MPEFAALLLASGIERLVDIRTVPRSRTNPQFNRDTLPATLVPYGIVYEHLYAAACAAAFFMQFLDTLNISRPHRSD